jgi:hypothetical protein
MTSSLSAPESQNNLGSVNSSGKYDAFYRPENEQFYASFPYEALDRNNHEIRLVRFDPDWPWPGSGVMPEECALKITQRVPLSAAPQYCCLSYVAGSPRETAEIYVDRHSFNAFANLFWAMIDVRRFWHREFPDQPLQLWVDQICINQSDALERAQQVGLMKEIYRRAEHVIIPLELKNSRELSSGSLTDWASCFLDSKPPPYRRSLGIEGSIIEHPWWSRAWIFQEFILASRAWFLFGWDDCRYFRDPPSLPWTDLQIALQLHKEPNSPLRSSPLPPSPSLAGRLRSMLHVNKTGRYASKPSGKSSIDQNRASVVPQYLRKRHHHVESMFSNKLQWNGEHQLLSLLSHARRCEASDRRDKIYAFLGLASPKYWITPDYSPNKSVNHVLLDVARKIIAVDKRLDILQEAARNNRLVTSADPLPTWVPDWAYTGDELHDIYLTALELPDDAKATGDHPAVASFQDVDGRAGEGLIARGICVGTLSRVIKDDYRRSWRWLSCPTTYAAQREVNAVTKSTAQSGDEIWLLYGSNWPWSCRKTGERYSLIGPAMLWTLRSSLVPGEPSSILYGSCLWDGGAESAKDILII